MQHKNGLFVTVVLALTDEDIQELQVVTPATTEVTTLDNRHCIVRQR